MIGILDLRQAHAEFFAEIKPTVALTLTYNTAPISRDRIARDLRNLHAEIECRLYGRRFYKRPPAMRTRFWAVTEMLDLNPHVHMGWALPPAGVETLIYALKDERIWLNFAPRGKYDLQPYGPGWTGYATKCLTNSNQIVMSSDFLPHK